MPTVPAMKKKKKAKNEDDEVDYSKKDGELRNNRGRKSSREDESY